MLGNHDTQANMDGRTIMEFDVKHPFSFSKVSEEGLSGDSVYYLPVYSSRVGKDGNRKVSAILWFFDSGSEGCMGVKDVYGCVEPDQVEWYKKEAQKVRELYGKGIH